MLDQNKEIVICKYCGRPEFWGDMRWLSGRCTCRDCYKEEYEREYKRPYTWDDLDGRRPTMEEYELQEAERERLLNAVIDPGAKLKEYS